MTVGRKQRLMLMLTVDVDEAFADILQHGDRSEPAIDPALGFSRRRDQFAGHEELGRSVVAFEAEDKTAAGHLMFFDANKDDAAGAKGAS